MNNNEINVPNGNVPIDVDEGDGNDAVAGLVQNGRGDGVLDGGVAGDGTTGEGAPSSSSCDLVLLIEFMEELPLSLASSSTHAVYSKGKTVSIGLDKNTPLSKVFARYCQFANSYDPGDHQTSDSCTHSIVCKDPSELEFLHCSLLDPLQTAETSALMKNDRLFARLKRKNKREHEIESMHLQRDSDRDFFEQMRHFLPDLTPSPLKCHVIFQCNGKISDENGYKQEVLTTNVKGHLSLLSRRCHWLSEKILIEKQKLEQPSSMTDTHNHQSPNFSHPNPIVRSSHVNTGAVKIPETDVYGKQTLFHDEAAGKHNHAHDDDGITSVEDTTNKRQFNNINNNSLANEVEDDEEEQIEENDPFSQTVKSKSSEVFPKFSMPTKPEAVNKSNHLTRTSPHLISSSKTSPSSNLLVVPLPHPPEAVKILLEYCYTNRVRSLGQEAYFKSFDIPDPNSVPSYLRKFQAPICPFRDKPWPKKGRPTISLYVALAGIQLAEEAKMKRLSLMCEIAASLLVTKPHILEALSLCQLQYKRTRNNLPLLRKAIMSHHILGNRSRGVTELSSIPSFHEKLIERKDLVVPTLIMGIKDVLGDKKDHLSPNSIFYHDGNKNVTYSNYLRESKEYIEQ